jgi:RND family efflux transporter MFP subunit
MVEQQLQRKKEQVKKLNEEILALEQMALRDSTEEVKFRVPVSVKEIQPESFAHYMYVNGRLEAENDAYISPEMNGQIERIYVQEGQEVKEGQLLASLNTSITESSIREVETGLELAQKLYEKQKDLWDQNIGSELQYLEAKNAKEQAEARLETLRAQLDMARIKAPFAGTVEKIMQKEGELAIPGVQLIQLISLDDLKLYGNVSERYMTSIRKGDQVTVTFPEVEGISVKTPIHRVGNVIDNASRTFRIEIKINNKNRALKPNMYSMIRINDFSSDKAFVVPSVAIKQDIKGNYLYVADLQTEKAVKRYVKIGLSFEDQTMILEGLNGGDNAIVKGFAQVSDGVDIDLR